MRRSAYAGSIPNLCFPCIDIHSTLIIGVHTHSIQMPSALTEALNYMKIDSHVPTGMISLDNVQVWSKLVTHSVGGIQGLQYPRLVGSPI